MNISMKGVRKRNLKPSSLYFVCFSRIMIERRTGMSSQHVSPPTLERFEIDNFKSLNEFVFPVRKEEDLSLFSCLVGLNGAGKSTILQAFDFIHHLASGTIDTWLTRRGWKLSELTNRFGQKKVIRFSLDIASHGTVYVWSGVFNTVSALCTWETISKKGDKSSLLSMKEGTLVYKKGSENVSTRAKDFSYRGSVLSFLKGDEEQMPGITAVQQFITGLKSLELLNPQIIKSRSREADDVGPGGERLAGYLFHLDKKESERVITDLRKFYPRIDDTRAQSLRAGWKSFWVTEHYGSSGRIETEIQHLNDGMLRILTIIAQVRSGRGFILLDEIENGINPELVEQLMDYLVRSGKQILVTTHSPIVLNYLEDEVARRGLYLVYKESDGTTRCERYFSSSLTNEKLAFLGPGEIFVDTAIDSLAKDLEKNRR